MERLEMPQEEDKPAMDECKEVRIVKIGNLERDWSEWT